MNYLKFLLVISFYYTAFLIVHFIKYGVISHTKREIEYLLVFLASTIISSLLTRKFKKLKTKKFVPIAKNYLKTFVINLGILSLVVNFLPSFTYSRILIFGSISLGFLFEFIFIGLQSEFTLTSNDKKMYSFSKVFFIIDFIILVWITIYAFLGFDFTLYSINEKILFLIVFYAIWFVNGTIAREFDTRKGNDFSVIVWNHIKSYVMLFFITSSIVFLLGIPLELKKVIVVLIVLFAILSSFAIIIYYLYKSTPKTDAVLISLLKTTNMPERALAVSSSKVEVRTITEEEKYSDVLKNKLKNVYLKEFPNVYKFLKEKIVLESFGIEESVVHRSADVYNVKVLPKNSLQIYINLHELNDIRKINEYLSLINSKLKNNGFFIGRIVTNKLKHQKFHKNSPFYLANIKYFFNFIWNRVFPKLPFLNRVFVTFSKGKNRALSMAEGLGRLYHAGFEVKNIKEINNSLYFIAGKVGEPVSDKNPSYGLIFKMKRNGENGKEIFVYKMRTMYPYSEYLQKFVHDNFSLKEGGKFENDFRVTSWGGIMRKLWLDELPMLINVFKRELKIVGVRPLSSHFLSLYSDNLKQLRSKHKPGLIPPYYADMPKTLDEIMFSEEKYFKKYDENPIVTDISYLTKIFKNIVIHRARSG